MENLKLKLKQLKIQEKQLKKIVDQRFSNEEEFKMFVDQNKEVFQKIKKLKKEINDIEWEIMSDEEKDVHLKYLKDLNEKFKAEE